MYVGSNVCRYIIWRETFSEVSFARMYVVGGGGVGVDVEVCDVEW